MSRTFFVACRVHRENVACDGLLFLLASCVSLLASFSVLSLSFFYQPCPDKFTSFRQSATPSKFGTSLSSGVAGSSNRRATRVGHSSHKQRRTGIFGIWNAFSFEKSLPHSLRPRKSQTINARNHLDSQELQRMSLVQCMFMVDAGIYEEMR